MKLHLFPHIHKAFQMIYDDQPYPAYMNARIVDAHVPETWVTRFEIADSILSKVNNLTIQDCKIPVKWIASELQHGDIQLTDSAFEQVVIGVNDAPDAIMKAVGATRAQIKTTNTVLYEFFDGELRDVFQTKLKIVVVLDVMWGIRGDKPVRWFRINPYNHSGRRLMGLIGHGDFKVTNACPDVVYSASGKGTPSKPWLRANLKALQPGVVLVCGKVASATFEQSMCPSARIVTMDHPAARTWSKRTLAIAKRKISEAIKGI